MKLPHKRKTASVKKTPAPAIQYVESPDWVKQMHSYFEESGSYRAEDLQRVLGDSRQSVRAESTADSPFACCIVVK